MLKNIFLPLILLTLFIASSVWSQQQTSGGAAVTLQASSAVIGHVIVDSAPSTVVTNANLDVALSTRLKPADTLAGVTTVGAVTAITNPLPAGTNLLGVVKTVPVTACGTTVFDSGGAFLPTASTAVTATTTCVMVMHFNNTDTVSHTVTVTDGSTTCAGAACTYYGGTSPNFSLPPGFSDVPLEGMKLVGGVKWQVTDASTNKVMGQVYGFQ